MAIDFLTVLREHYGPESTPKRLEDGAFYSLQNDLRRACLTYLTARTGNDKRTSEIMGQGRTAIQRQRSRYGIPSGREQRRV